MASLISSLSAPVDVRFEPASNSWSLANVSRFQVDAWPTVENADLLRLPKRYFQEFIGVFNQIVKDPNIQKELGDGRKNGLSISLRDGKICYRFEGDFYKRAIYFQKPDLIKRLKKIAKKIGEYTNRYSTSIYENYSQEKIETLISEQGEFQKILDKNVDLTLKDALLSAGGRWLYPVDDMLVLVRKSVCIRAVFHDKNPTEHNLISGLEIGSNVSGMIFGSMMAKAGIDNYRASQKIGDKEGKKEGLSSLVRGTLSILGTGFFAGIKMSDALNGPVVGSAFAAAGGSVFVGATVLSAGVSACHIMRCNRFRRKINNFLKNDKLSEKEKIKGVLNFFKEQIKVSDFELKKIKDKINKKYPDLSKEGFEKKLSEKLMKRIVTKRRRFERRSGFKSRLLVEHNVDAILAKLEHPAYESLAVKDGLSLIAKVKGENGKKIKMFSVMLLASAIGLLALFFMIFVHVGIVSNILSSIATTMWLGVTFYGICQAIESYKLRKADGSVDASKEFYSDLQLPADVFNDYGF
jgi:hypothetical protein